MSDYLIIACLILVPWVIWKVIDKASKDCCPECINGGFLKGRWKD